MLEARQELEDTYYDRSVSNQQEALDKELEAFREEKDKEIEGWDEYVTETERVVADGLATIQNNTDAVYNTLQEMGEEYSLSIADALTSPWKHGEDAIQSYSEKFKIGMSKTVEELKNIAKEHKQLIDEIEAHGNNNVGTVNDNVAGYQEAEKAPKKPSGGGSSGNSGGSGSSSSAGMVSGISGYIQYGQSGDKVKALQQALNDLGFNCGNVDGKFGPKTELALKNFQQSSKYGGAISADGVVGPNTKKKFKVAGYASGTTGVKKDQFAVIDELGEELVIRPSKGKMTFLEKGSSVIPADLTANLMEWGELDPSIMLERNKPVISAPHITNNNMEVNMEIAEVVHVDHVDSNNLPDLTKAVEKQLDKYMKQLNGQIRKYAR